jgi:uncharacterized protein
MSSVGSVRSAPERSRYEYVVDGEVLAIAEYDERAGYVVMHHTHTEPAHRGQGMAAHVVAGALDDLRRRDLQVEPTCWYVARFIDSHPAYRDLLVDTSAARRGAPGGFG